MARITDKEKKELHDILDTCVEKLETPKNLMKPHWDTLSIQELRDLIMVECFELNHAMNTKSVVSIRSECKDIIAYSMFILSNLNKITKGRLKE